MKPEKVTLNDIAEKAGVSISTVHKALYCKPGISDKVKNEITAIADGMGYKANFVASSLKRKPLKLAFVMPLPDFSPNRYFYHDIWKGMRAVQAEAAQFNVEILEFGFDGTMDNLPRKLEEIWKNHSDELSGLITLGLEDAASSYFIGQFIKKKIPVVLIASDLPNSNRLCCVSSQDTMAGSLGAEMIANFTSGNGKVIVAAGDVLISSHYLNVEGFEKFLTESSSPLTTVKLYNNDDLEKLYRDVCGLLKSDSEIKALYSCTARNTVPLCQAVIDTGMQGKIKVVGNDLFRENKEMLLRNILQAVIYKNPYMLGFTGCKSMFNYVAKSEYPVSDTIFITPVIVVKSNLQYYESDALSEN